MYKHFYGLKKEPFNITPDPNFLYLSPTHREALAQIIYGVKTKKGFIVITGEVGVGKTTVLNASLKKLEENGSITAFIFNPELKLMDFFYIICNELGLPKPRTKAEFLINLNDFLIDCLAKGKEPVVLFIDEAQRLSSKLLEEIRLLLNLETGAEKLLQIVLSGQPELWEKINSTELRQLKQRISLRHTIKPLNSKEVKMYVKERLTKAGGRDDIFNDKAIDKIYKYSGGIPRLINIICSNALITGYVAEKKVINAKIIKETVNDLDLVSHKPKRSWFLFKW